jgi:hypothetical protein
MGAPQATYIGQAQTVQQLWNQLRNWYWQVKAVGLLTNGNGAQNVWKAMATAAQNADGSLGAADATPVNTDPITVGNLNMSADDIINALNDMTALASVFDGTAGTGYNASINHLNDAQSLLTLTSG